MKHSIRISHNFEAAHRLHQTPGKCNNLHGHSFWVHLTLKSSSLDPSGMLMEFGNIKRLLRRWIDEHLDHGIILHKDDPLAPVLSQFGDNVRTLPYDATTENIAMFIHSILDSILIIEEGYKLVEEIEVYVQETTVNGAGYIE